MTSPQHRRRLESLAVFATVIRSGTLLRTQLAYLLFAAVELATWVAILVYAYDQGGATASGLVAFAQLAPAVVFAPLAAAVGDRMARTRVLAIAHLGYALTNMLVAALMFSGQAPLVVYAGAIVASLALTVVRPAHAAVMPEISGSPSELTAANVASSTTEGLGIIVGSIGGGLLLASAGAGAVYLAGGLASFAAFLLVVRLRRAGPGVHRHDHVAHPEQAHISEAPAAADTGRPGGPDDAPGAAVGDLVTEMAEGVRTGLGNRLLRPLVVIIGLSSVLQGAADVLLIVLALDVAGMGEPGVGLLNGAIGLGGLLGAALAIGLVGQRRLLGALVIAAIGGGAGLVLPGLAPLPVVGLAGFLALGVGRALIDVISRTLLQRVAPDRYLTRVFGLVEGAAMAGLAVGALLAPVLVALVGPSPALVLAGCILPVGAVVLRGALARSEVAGVVHERELAVIRRIEMFGLLPLPFLERLAAHTTPVRVPAGTPVIVEGDPGDAYFMIETGRCVVSQRRREVNRLGPGDGFGEIALLHDVPRTATVTAVDDVELLRLDRGPFLEALAGQSGAYALAREAAERHLGHLH